MQGKLKSGTASGKTTFTKKLAKHLHIQEKLTIMGMDNFYWGIPENIENPDDYDFDHPKSLDFDYMYKCLRELLSQGETMAPQYCFKTHSRKKEKVKLVSKEVLIFEGILSMHDERIRNLFDLKIFIHCDADIALARRI